MLVFMTIILLIDSFVIPYGISRDVIQAIPWGSPPQYSARSLHLWHLFRKSVSIYKTLAWILLEVHGMPVRKSIEILVDSPSQKKNLSPSHHPTLPW